jgi:predicted Zn-dependent peptidase
MLFVKNDFKTIQLSIYFTDLDEKESSVYRFLLPKLITTHTHTIGSKKLMNEKLEDLYGAYFKSRVERIGNLSVASIQMTFVNPKIIEDDHLFDQALELFHQVIFDHETFNIDIFEEEKRMLLEQWETIKDKKRIYAVNQFNQYFFEHDAYGYPISGTYKDIKKLNIDKLHKYYNQILLKNNIRLIANGDLSQEQMDKIMHFGLQKTTLETPLELKFRGAREAIEIKEETKMQQAILKIGYHFPIFRNDPLYYPAILLDDILGGYPESRLFQDIREKQGLCYDISSNYDPYKGVMFISSGVDLKHMDHALDSVKRLVNELIQEGVTPTELEHAKAYFSHELKSSLDSQGIQTRRIFLKDILGFNETIEEKLVAIEKVTIESLKEAAQYLTLDTVYILHGGEK